MRVHPVLFKRRGDARLGLLFLPGGPVLVVEVGAGAGAHAADALLVPGRWVVLAGHARRLGALVVAIGGGEQVRPPALPPVVARGLFRHAGCSLRCGEEAAALLARAVA